MATNASPPPLRKSQRARKPTRRALVRWLPINTHVLSSLTNIRQGIDAASESEEDSDNDDDVDVGAIEDSEEDSTFEDADHPRKRPRLESEEDDSLRPSQLVSEDITNFLKLCQALQTLVGGEITDAEIEAADTLIREYGLGLIEVRKIKLYTLHLTPYFVRSFMAQTSSSRIIIMLPTSASLFATSVHYTASGHFYSSG